MKGWDGGAPTLLLLSRSNSIRRAGTGDGETCRGTTKDRLRVQARVHRLPHNWLRVIGFHSSLFTDTQERKKSNTQHLQRRPSQPCAPLPVQ